MLCFRIQLIILIKFSLSSPWVAGSINMNMRVAYLAVNPSHNQINNHPCKKMVHRIKHWTVSNVFEIIYNFFLTFPTNELSIYLWVSGNHFIGWIDRNYLGIKENRINNRVGVKVPSPLLLCIICADKLSNSKSES